MPSDDKLLIEEDGVLEGAVYAINFTGAGAAVTVTGGKATVTVSGGGGSSGASYFPGGWG
jgi:hypothetical protein